jgi:hypothetical protein
MKPTAEGLAVSPRKCRQRSLLMRRADGVSQGCPAGCCPHPCSDPVSSTANSTASGFDCPSDLPGAAMPERVIHLYRCQGLSTYRIEDLVGISRQRVTRLLHRAGIHVKSRGSGRRRLPRGAGATVPDALLADLYLNHRLTCAQISELTQIPPRTVHGRLRAQGITLRTRGRFNREDRLTVDPEILADMYLRAGLSSGEVGEFLGVSRTVVLRTAHDEGLPVRVGGPAPSRGPTEIELITALYADPGVRQALARHGLPTVPPGGPIWQRFPVPARLSPDLAEELYVSCGIGVHHIELLTGQPADAVCKLLHAAGVALRPAGGRSPFMRRWRASQSGLSSPRGHWCAVRFPRRRGLEDLK